MTRYIQLPSLLALTAALGCGETTNTPPSQLTFDRPSDIAFACHGLLRITNGGPADASQPIEISAMPPAACDIRSLPAVPVACRPGTTEPATPAGQETLRDAACNVVSQVSPVAWYGLILQSGPGTVAIAQFTPKPPVAGASAGDDVVVLDADPFTPGKNSIAVGEEPVAIHTDPAGCHAITANAGSCDLSVLDLNSALDTERGARVDRVEVKNAAGEPIRSRPAAMVGEPSRQDIGNACPADPTGLVYVAYPSCHLVAAVDTSTGTIVSGIQYDAAGTPTIVGGDVSCPAECGGGAAPTPGVRPVALDLEVDPRSASRRLVIGADNSASITVVDLDGMWRPSLVSQVALEDSTGNLGITSLALSPEIGMGGFGQMIDDDGPGGTFQFVYAVATDGTVRVADVLDERHECDTQVDPRFAREIGVVRDLSCLPIGTLMTPRRPYAISPGIHLPGDAIPLSVEFFISAEPIGEGRPGESPGTLLGHFAVITASNGSAFLVNVDDDNFHDVWNPNAPLAVPVQLAQAHQLRDLVGDRFLTIEDEDLAANDDDNRDCDYAGKFTTNGDAIGGPRATAAPSRTVPTGSVAPEKLTQLPGGRQLVCERKKADGSVFSRKAISELVYAAPAGVRDVSFPDLMALPETETWSLVWEGSLSLNTGGGDVDGPAIRESSMRVDSAGLHVLDDAEPFCDAGVEPFDILQLRGCDPSIGSADCPSGYTCFVHPESQVQGLGACMLADEADRLANACKDYLTTLRRYTIATASTGELVALPRRVELRTTPLDGCTDDAQCEALADYALKSVSSRHPSEDTTAADPRTWACVADPLRAPRGGTGKRCELRCDSSADCLTGTICQGAVSGQAKSGFCMEGVIPPQSCINAPQRYELHAGEAFSVIGSETGFVHPIVADAAGKCVRNPADRLSIGRIPLVPRDPLAPDNVHVCDPAADPFTGQLANGTFEPNPCLTTVSHAVVQPVYQPGTCTLEREANGDPRVTLAELQVPAVRFRNRQMTMTLAEPHYPGDAVCITDRQANLGQIPHVVPGLTLQFRQTGGFVPLRVLAALTSDDAPSFPVKIVRGPTGSLWVLDEGDFLSSSATQASTRGKVLRFHPISPALVNVYK